MTDAPDLEPLFECLHHANPTDDSQWHVKPGMHNAFSKAVSALAARSAPEAGKAAVKPLDLSNLLRHAFMFGFETMGGTSDAAKDWWPEYNPEECPAFDRILSALASSPAPTGAEDDSDLPTAEDVRGILGPTKGCPL